MALLLNRRHGRGVGFYKGTDPLPFIRVTPYFDERYPDEIVLRIEAPREITILRDELTRRPPPPLAPRANDYNQRREDARVDRRRDDDWFDAEERV